jgi:hypothetical protein
MKKLLVLAAAVALFLPLAALSASSPRSGDLHVTKECSAYTFAAGSYCTITWSNLNAIDAGAKVIYASAAGATSLNSDIVLYAGPGNSAFGHVTLDFVTLSGVVTLSGGTGRFSGFHASRCHIRRACQPVALGRDVQLCSARPQRVTAG